MNDITPQALIIQSDGKFGPLLREMVKKGWNKGVITLKDGTTRRFYVVHHEEKDDRIEYYIDLV